MKARPFHVSTYGVSPDLQRVHPAFKILNRGDLSRQKLLEVLEKYRQIETDWSPKASHVTIETEAGRFTVRAPEKKLTLANEGETAAGELPLTAAEIVARLEMPVAISFAPKPPPPEPMGRRIVSIVLLVAGLTLISHTLNSVFVRPDTRPARDLAFVTDPADLKRRQNDVAGVFATGQQAGDRQLTITADGHIVFAELGPRQSLGNATETYRIARRGSRTVLVTTHGGVIEALEFNTLVYYGDTYRRR